MKEINTKEFFNNFKPERVIFVVSIDANGKPSGMSAGWMMKCSSNPPMFAVALSKKGYTHKLIRESKEFVVAVPDKSFEEQIEYFGSTHGNEIDKFKETKIETVPSQYCKTPLIKNATFNIECKLVKETEAGDHIVFIGEILKSYENKGRKILMNMAKQNGKRIYQEF